MILPYIATALLLLVTAYSAVVSFRQKPDVSPPTWAFPSDTKRFSHMIVGIFTIAVFAGLAMWLAIGARNSTRRSSQFLIPEGYVGWVRVEFQAREAPSALVEDGEYVFRIPLSGLLRTSSAEQYGWAKDRYYYSSKEGVRMLPDTGQGSARFIWGKINGEESGSERNGAYEEFFVGTEQQFRDQLKASPSSGSSLPGSSSK